MIPVNGDFRLLYFAYGLVFVILVGGILISENKKLFKRNLIVYFIYTGIMIFMFSDEENFKYGGSLVVLIYGAAFPIIHAVVFVLYKIYRELSKSLSSMISKEEYWNKFDQLIQSLQKDKNFDVVLELKEAQRYVNGMTDGWFEFLNEFNRIMATNRDRLSRQQIDLADN